MFLLQLRRDQVVVAHEEGLEGGQLEVFVAPDVASHEEFGGGQGAFILHAAQRLIDGGQLFRREVGGIVVRQQVARAGL